MNYQTIKARKYKKGNGREGIRTNREQRKRQKLYTTKTSPTNASVRKETAILSPELVAYPFAARAEGVDVDVDIVTAAAELATGMTTEATGDEDEATVEFVGPVEVNWTFRA